ncbi:MAG: helix-turn-helix domain-containing protein [Candidatus Kapabacteria bacterium]|nr:helix-turn-helix domain-containing protein [Candidatus Kapabacteria bacterium]
MKFVTPLNEATREQLRSIVSSDAPFHKRRRSRAILLSNQGFKVDIIASIFEVTRDTVSAWIDPWEEEAFDGLEDTPLLHPQQSNRARLVVEKKLKKSLSPKTIRRHLQESGYSYRRIWQDICRYAIENSVSAFNSANG